MRPGKFKSKGYTLNMVKTKTPRQSLRTRFSRRQAIVGALLAVLLTGTAVFAAAQNEKPASSEEGVKQSSIDIKTIPPGATITLDGKEVKEKSDTNLKTSVGKHTLQLKLAGYDDQNVEVTVLEEGPATVEHVFVKDGVTVVGTPNAPGKAATVFPADQLQTYTSEKFRYSIQQPKNWLVKTDPSGVPHFYNEQAAEQARKDPGAELEESLVILAVENPKSLSAKAFYEQREEFAMEDQSQITKKEVTVAGQTAYRYESPYGFVPTITTIVTRGDKAFLLQIFQRSPDRKIYDQLVSTFRFL